MRGMMMTKMASAQVFLQASLRPDILDKIEMSVDIDGHFVTIYTAMCYSFMSIKKVDKKAIFLGIYRYILAILMELQAA